MDSLALFRRGNPTAWEEILTQSVAQRLKEGPSRGCPPGDPPYILSLNKETNMDVNNHLLTGTLYSCLLRRFCHYLTNTKVDIPDKHWTEHKFPSGGARERTQGTKGAVSPSGRKTL